MTDANHVQWGKFAAIANIFSALIAFVAAILNIMNLFSIINQYNLMQHDSDVRIRPWIKTKNAGFISQLQKGQYATIAIEHKNFGDAVAKRWAPDDFKIHVVGSDVSFDDAAKDNEHFTKDCMGKKPPNNAGYLEFSGEEETSYQNVDADKITDDLISGKSFLIMNGCYVYSGPSDTDKLHHTTFCMLYRFGTQDYHVFGNCSYGNAFD